MSVCTPSSDRANTLLDLCEAAAGFSGVFIPSVVASNGVNPAFPAAETPGHRPLRRGVPGAGFD